MIIRGPLELEDASGCSVFGPMYWVSMNARLPPKFRLNQIHIPALTTTRLNSALEGKDQIYRFVEIVTRAPSGPQQQTGSSVTCVIPIHIFSLPVNLIV